MRLRLPCFGLLILACCGAAAAQSVGCGSPDGINLYDQTTCGNVSDGLTPLPTVTSGNDANGNPYTLTACPSSNLNPVHAGDTYALANNIGSSLTATCITASFVQPFNLVGEGYTVTGQVNIQQNNMNGMRITDFTINCNGPDTPFPCIYLYPQGALSGLTPLRLDHITAYNSHTNSRNIYVEWDSPSCSGASVGAPCILIDHITSTLPEQGAYPVTYAVQSGGVITYTSNNSLNVGDVPNLTSGGCTSPYNVSGLPVATASPTQFTINLAGSAAGASQSNCNAIVGGRSYNISISGGTASSVDGMIEAKNLNVTIPGDVSAGQGIVMFNVYGAYVHNCEFSTPANSSPTYGGDNSRAILCDAQGEWPAATPCRISNNYLDVNGNRGIRIRATAGLNIFQNYFDHLNLRSEESAAIEIGAMDFGILDVTGSNFYNNTCVIEGGLCVFVTSSKGLVAHDNYVQCGTVNPCGSGSLFADNDVDSTNVSLTNITRPGGSLIATATIQSSDSGPGLTSDYVGTQVNITGASDSTLNCTSCIVLSVPTNLTFTYTSSASASSTVSSASAIMYPNNSGATYNNNSTNIGSLPSPQIFVCPTCTINFGSGLGIANATICNSGTGGGGGNIILSSACGNGTAAPPPPVIMTTNPFYRSTVEHQPQAAGTGAKSPPKPGR